jgi:hypothetical protein
VEDWALIRRLVADGVPRRKVARDLGIGRATVDRALASDRPLKYERVAGPTSFTPFEARVRALLAEHPEMPATVIAERVGWDGSITWFRDNVRQLRPAHRPPDPADRLTWEPGDAAQCDLWFPPAKIPLVFLVGIIRPVMNLECAAVITSTGSNFAVPSHRCVVSLFDLGGNLPISYCPKRRHALDWAEREIEASDSSRAGARESGHR